MTEPRTKRGTAVDEPVTPEADSAPDEATTETPATAPEAEPVIATTDAQGDDAAEAPAETEVEPEATAEPAMDAAPEAPADTEAEPVVAATAEPAADAASEATPEPEAEAASVAAADAPEAQAAPSDVPEAEAATQPAAEADEAPSKPAAEAQATPDVAAETMAEAEPRAAAVVPPAAEPEARPSRSRATAVLAPKAFKDRYTSDVVPALTKQFEYANPNMVPKIDKIVVNIGLGEALTNAKAIDAAASDLTMITGQKPIVTKARRSIAQFKIRTGNPIGLKVTLRGDRMWDFLERMTMLALPRIRDFRGVPGRSFDGRGNYSLGLREQIAFPEIDYDKVDRLRGLEVSIVTTAKSDEESKRLLELLGMPFAS
jgi:large subunit ribosomal protein L5